jgi:hypothetical protein
MKTLYYIGAMILALFATSCEQPLEVFGNDTGVNFYRWSTADTVINFSFLYGPADATQDTVWLDMETIGRLPSAPRPVLFEQTPAGDSDAVPNVHYVPFDTPALAGAYVIPANQSRALVPVILLRDPSLKTRQATLRLRIKSSDEHALFDLSKQHVRIVFSDQLERPTNWNSLVVTNLAGEYGPVKHLFLIEHTQQKWDYDYLYNELGFSNTSTVATIYDITYCKFLRAAYTRELEEYNAERQSRGEDVLKEADGTIVSFE